MEEKRECRDRVMNTFEQGDRSLWICYQKIRENEIKNKLVKICNNLHLLSFLTSMYFLLRGVTCLGSA